MTDHATALGACLPDDPNDHDPIGVPSDAVRGVLLEVLQRRDAEDDAHEPVRLEGE